MHARQLINLMSFWLVDNFCNISYIAWKFGILSNEWIERNTLTFIFKPINNHIYYYLLCFSSLTDDYKSRPTSRWSSHHIRRSRFGYTERQEKASVQRRVQLYIQETEQEQYRLEMQCQEQNNQLSSSGVTTRRPLWCTQQQDPHPCSPTRCSHSCEYS